MDKIVFVADLGHFNAYKLSKTPQGTGRLDLIESFDAIDARGKFSDKFSDQAGNFGESVGKNSSAKGSGEAHNIEIENEKRLIKTIAKNIAKIVKDERCDVWHLAAEKAINGQILEFIEPGVKAKLQKNIPSNLTKADKTEIVNRFV